MWGSAQSAAVVLLCSLGDDGGEAAAPLSLAATTRTKSSAHNPLLPTAAAANIHGEPLARPPAPPAPGP